MKKLYVFLFSLSLFTFFSCASDSGTEETDLGNENIPTSTIVIPDSPDEIPEPLVRDLEILDDGTVLIDGEKVGTIPEDKVYDYQLQLQEKKNSQITNKVTTKDAEPAVSKADKTVTKEKDNFNGTTPGFSPKKEEPKATPAPSKLNNPATSTDKEKNTAASKKDTKTTDTASNKIDSTSNKNTNTNSNQKETNTPSENTKKSDDNNRTNYVNKSDLEKNNINGNELNKSGINKNDTKKESNTKKLSSVPEKPKSNAEYPGFVKDDIEPSKEEMNYQEKKEFSEGVVPSRKVTLKKGEMLQVIYPGSGWIYLGSLSEYNNLESRGRKVGDTQTIYTLYAKSAGTQIHHFYKTDNLTGNFIDDYLEVTVLDIKGSITTCVRAPEYSLIVPKQPERPALASTKNLTEEETTPQEINLTQPQNTLINANINELPDDKKNEEYVEKTKTEIESLNKSVETISESEINYYNFQADDLLKLAKELYQKKDYAQSYKAVQTFLIIATDKVDEGLYLKGQILEADNSLKDIKNAITTYEDLIQNYPSSSLWDDANKRITYLKRFYIDIY